MLPCEVNVDAISKIGNFGRYHIRGSIAHKGFLAMFASKVTRILNYLPSTVLTHTCSVENPLIVLYS
jgi:hypothetical protein